MINCGLFVQFRSNIGVLRGDVSEDTPVPSRELHGPHAHASCAPASLQPEHISSHKQHGRDQLQYAIAVLQILQQSSCVIACGDYRLSE